jgi:hypothetical protein
MGSVDVYDKHGSTRVEHSVGDAPADLSVNPDAGTAIVSVSKTFKIYSGAGAVQTRIEDNNIVLASYLGIGVVDGAAFIAHGVQGNSTIDVYKVDGTFEHTIKGARRRTAQRLDRYRCSHASTSAQAKQSRHQAEDRFLCCFLQRRRAGEP